MLDFSSKIKWVVAVVLISASTFLAFAPAFKNGFVNWDDDAYVISNPAIKSLSLPHLKKMTTSLFVGHYQPLTVFSLALNYHFSRLRPFSYHATNIVLHVANSLLVAWLVFLLSGRFSVAFIVAILFGIHPLHVESVAWVSERKDVLYALFFLGSLIGYIYYLRRSRISAAYVVSLLLFLFSLLAKAMAMTLPLILFLLDYFYARKKSVDAWLDKVPFLTLSFVFAGLALFGVFESHVVRSEELFRFFPQLAVASFALLFYASKIIFPAGLCALYPYSGQGWDVFPLEYLIAPFLVVFFLVLFFFTLRRRKNIVFGVLFYGIILLPVLQFVPGGSIIVADRYAYLASLGLFYIFGLIVSVAAARATKKRPWRYVLYGFLLFILFGGILLTRARCAVWKDGVTLWRDALKNNADSANAATIYNNLGMALEARGERDQALLAYKKTLAIRPGHYLANNNLGRYYGSQGQYDVAVKFFKKAAAIDPHRADAYANLCITYAYLKMPGEALEACGKAIEVEPDSARGYLVLGDFFYQNNDLRAAVVCYRQVMTLNPDSVMASRRLGQAFLLQGDLKHALAMFQKAVALNPQDEENHIFLGLGYASMGRIEDAISAFQKSVDIKPTAIAFKNLSWLYLKKKKWDQAAYCYEQARRLGERDDILYKKLKPYLPR